MTDQQLISKIAMLSSKQLKQALLSYLDYLLSKQFASEKTNPKRVPRFGCAKSKFRLSHDFKEPIDHFAGYMPE